jgi:hypothetical protein
VKGIGDGAAEGEHQTRVRGPRELFDLTTQQRSARTTHVRFGIDFFDTFPTDPESVLITDRCRKCLI